jgi:hypothetical protein
VWIRQTQESGLLVADTFTSEPNEPHLLVVFYYVVGQLSRYTGAPPEFLYTYLGSGFAFALTILLFVTVRHFLRAPHQVWCVFLAILLGGGLGAHLKLLSYLGQSSSVFVLQRLIVEPLRDQPTFDDFRFAYVFVTLFDTHTSLNWLATIASVLSLYFTLRGFSLVRVIVTAVTFAGMTLLHVYEGVTLLMITAAVGVLCWRKGLVVRPALITMVACTLSVGASLLLLWVLYHSSGLPVTPWRARTIPFSVVVLAYPLAWALIGWGLFSYWRRAGLNECFLLGWALGCTALTLSGPFYPYPDRGAMTLQLPLFIMAGSIYFARHSRVTLRAALVAALMLGAGPVFELVARQWVPVSFRTDAPYMFVSEAHHDVINRLREQAGPDDVLLATDADVLWLAPEFPGKLYLGHFFLTVDYERKRGEVARFFDSSPADQAAFLQTRRIRFVYAAADREPERLREVPGLSVQVTRPIGTLFEHSPPERDGPP